MVSWFRTVVTEYADYGSEYDRAVHATMKTLYAWVGMTHKRHCAGGSRNPQAAPVGKFKRV